MSVLPPLKKAVPTVAPIVLIPFVNWALTAAEKTRSTISKITVLFMILY
jgi:hypothetical protein